MFAFLEQERPLKQMLILPLPEFLNEPDLSIDASKVSEDIGMLFFLL